MPTYHLCGVVGHIIPNCSLLRQKLKSKSRFAVRNTDVPKFVHACHFCGVRGHIRPNCHKLKFNHFEFHSRMWDDFSPTIRPNKLFHMLLKSLSLLAWERKLQDFSLTLKKFTIPQIHSASRGFSPIMLKTRAIWVRKDLLRWVLFTCPWFNSFNCLWTCFVSVFGFSFFFFLFGCFLLKRIQKHWKFSKR